MLDKNPLAMSDEEFGQLDPSTFAELAGVASAPEPTVEPPVVEAPVEEAPHVEEVAQETPVEEQAPVEGETVDQAAGAEPAAVDGNPNPAEQPKEGQAAAEPVAPKAEGNSDPVAPAEPLAPALAQPTPDQAMAFYNQVMAPFNANGRKIQLQSPEEVLQLMQRGANYTRKMQAIAPHRKVLTMLQNNGIDEDKLSFLIDLEKGSPEAIQKLAKDRNVDLMQIDTEAETTYREGSHKVTDDEVAFRSQLEELNSTPEGSETLRTINTTWDQASKEVLWTEPALMSIINRHREDGTYDVISTELERRRMLGQIAADTPFIHAYKQVGDDLMSKMAPAGQPVTPPAAVAPPVPVAVTAAKPKPVVANSDKASAASPTRSTPKKAAAFVNPLAMSDEEFKASFDQFIGRV